MKLAYDLITNFYRKHKREIAAKKIRAEFDRIVDMESCNALSEIRNILKDPTLSDPECFKQIQEIVEVFEKYGSECGCRHNFHDLL